MANCPECGKWYIGKIYVNDCIKAHKKERMKKKIEAGIKPSSWKERFLWASGILLAGISVIGLLVLFFGDTGLVDALGSVTGLCIGWILFSAKAIGKIKIFFMKTVS